MSILSVFDGTFVKQPEYKACLEGGSKIVSWAELRTSFGPMAVDLTDTWYPNIKIGDRVKCDEGQGYFHNGRLVSYACGQIVINGVEYKEPA